MVKFGFEAEDFNSFAFNSFCKEFHKRLSKSFFTRVRYFRVISKVTGDEPMWLKVSLASEKASESDGYMYVLENYQALLW